MMRILNKPILRIAVGSFVAFLVIGFALLCLTSKTWVEEHHTINFVPRDLNLPKYEDHIQFSKQGMGSMISHEHKIRYWLHPKCASSTLRWWMWENFNASIIWNKVRDYPTYTAFTSIREPMSRFISGYNEEVRILKNNHNPDAQIFFRKPVSEAISTLYDEDFKQVYGQHILLQSFKLEILAPFLDFVVRAEHLKADMDKYDIPHWQGSPKGRPAKVKKMSISELTTDEIRKLCWILRRDYCSLKKYYDLPTDCVGLFDCTQYAPIFLKHGEI